MPNSNAESVNLSLPVSQPVKDWLDSLATSLENSAENVALYFLAARFKEPSFLADGFKAPTSPLPTHPLTLTTSH